MEFMAISTKQWMSGFGIALFFAGGIVISAGTTLKAANTAVDVRVLVTPSADLSAEQAVYAQLEALQAWQGERVDDALRQVWAFAHPQNKRITGPIQRFGAMLSGRSYAALIEHQSHDIQWLDEKPDSEPTTAAVFVRVLARDGQFYGFVWQLAKADSPSGAVWMTTSVSPAQLTGEQLSGFPESSLKKKDVCPLERPIVETG